MSRTDPDVICAESGLELPPFSQMLSMEIRRARGSDVERMNNYDVEKITYI